MSDCMSECTYYLNTPAVQGRLYGIIRSESAFIYTFETICWYKAPGFILSDLRKAAWILQYFIEPGNGE